jgi:hypothetical protein
MGALKPGAKNFVHIVVTGLKGKKDADNLKAAIRRLVKKSGGKAKASTRRKPQF